jgi:hypothetical protein
MDATTFGDIVPTRTLEIHIVRPESFGWAFDISVSAVWGVVPSLKYSATDLLWSSDRVLVNADLAVPYRRYVFDADSNTTFLGCASMNVPLPAR